VKSPLLPLASAAAKNEIDRSVTMGMVDWVHDKSKTANTSKNWVGEWKLNVAETRC
jgi:hypothetical protein